jgi:hypothetical protein
LFVVFLALVSGTARAQFSSSGDQTVTGQMGAGTATPRATLDVVVSSVDSYGLRVSSQDGSPLFLMDAAGRAGVGLDSPQALLDATGTENDGDIGLQLRSGNSSSTYSSSQIVFAYGSSGAYRDAMVTRAVPGQYEGNSVDFFLWNSTADPAALGTLHVLSLQASPAASTGSVHVMPVGTPIYELVVSDGQTTGGGTVEAAVVSMHSSRALKTVLATLGSADEERAYEEVKSLRPARFRYKHPGGGAGPLVRGLIYEDTPPDIRARRGQAISFEARLANMEMALAAANRRIADLEKKIAAAERGELR